VKKSLFLIAVFALVCILFSHEIIGNLLKLAARSYTHSQIEYRTLSWENGAFVFSDLAIFDPTFQVYVEKASIRLNFSDFPRKLKGHIHLISPHVSIVKKKNWDVPTSWFDFSYSVANGTLDWGGLAHFSLEKDKVSSYLALDWDGASVLLTYKDQQWDVDLTHFNITLLKDFFPWAEITKGEISGKMTLLDGYRVSSANLTANELALYVSRGSLQNVSGTLSLNSGLGAKWEVLGTGEVLGKKIPFRCQGKGFFKSDWLESKIEFQDAWLSISKEERWNVECSKIHAEEATLLLAAATPYFPELKEWHILKGTIDAKAELFFPEWTCTCRAESLALQKGDSLFDANLIQGELNRKGGLLFIEGNRWKSSFSGLWEDGTIEADLFGAQLMLKGGWNGSALAVQIAKGEFDNFTFQGDGWIDPGLDFFFSLHGKWKFLEKEIPFECPILSKWKDLWSFDFRFTRGFWDLMRLKGHYNGKQVFYSDKSHFLGSELRFTPCSLRDLDVAFTLPWDHVLAAGPILQEWGVDLAQIPPFGNTEMHCQLIKGKLLLVAQGEDPKFACSIEKALDEWNIDLESNLTLKASITDRGIAKGYMNWKQEASAEFNGKILPSLHSEFSLSKVSFDLKLIQDERLQGILTGSGHFLYNGQWDSDFDFTASSLIIHGHPMENNGSVHLQYSSLQGAQLKGVSLHGPFDCVIDLLQYEKKRASWVFKNSQMHIPSSFLRGRFLEFIDPDRDLNVTADLDFTSDFSTFICTMREGLIPFHGDYHRVENLQLHWSHSQCDAAFQYRDHFYRLQAQINDVITGRLTVGVEQEPLTIDWEYKDLLSVHSIEGCFGGVSASFHAEKPNVLVGSAHVDFQRLSHLLPSDVASVFQELQMGKGYELKGRLELQQNAPHFQGILSGKAIELFGFQFRTLLAQVDLLPETIRIYDLKISDSAGMLKVDDMLIKKKEESPFAISIPNLTIVDLRPSFLIRPGGKVGPIEPLVVRELQLKDFRGLLEDGKTWRAHGSLYFINTYKRKETVFDLPANLLSRIAGLDLELLIPVTGDLTFELENGYFNLLDLSHAYSEGQRSEFFLEMDPQPRMDLDGNLRIFIKMKQFVLLKFTESFLISIDGVLDAPEFHLKKKKFLGIF